MNQPDDSTFAVYGDQARTDSDNLVLSDNVVEVEFRVAGFYCQGLLHLNNRQRPFGMSHPAEHFLRPIDVILILAPDPGNCLVVSLLQLIDPFWQLFDRTSKLSYSSLSHERI
jgi:hypothetical protein